MAIKVLPEQFAATRASRRDSNERPRRSRRSPIPNILAVYDFGESDGVFYTVTELLEGGTLRSVLEGRTAHQPAWWSTIRCRSRAGFGRA